MSKLIAVTFAKVWRGYNVGETAGFPEDVATELVSIETATLYDPSTAPAAIAKGGSRSSRRPASPKPVVNKPTGVIGAGGGSDGQGDVAGTGGGADGNDSDSDDNDDNDNEKP